MQYVCVFSCVRLFVRDQEGRWGSDEVVPGPSVFHSREPGVSGNFRGRIKGAKYRFPLQDGTWDFPGDAVAGKGLILWRRWNHVVFLELHRDSRKRQEFQASHTPSAVIS